MEDPPITREQLVALATELSAKRDRQDYPITSATLQLRREYEQALQDAEPVNAQFIGDLESYAKTQCLKITEMMCNKLPVELRDLIYRYICIEDQPIPVGPYFHFRPYNRKVAPDRLASALSDGRVQIDHSERPDPTILMPDSHIFNIEYVGWTAMVEMKLAYLANNTFSICNVDQGIATFLDWNTSEGFVVTPRSTRSGPGPGFETAMSVTNSKADDFVRRLQIRVKCEHYDNQHPRYTSQNCCDFFDTECDHLRSSRISLEPLTYLDPRDRPLELEFIIMTALRSDPTATEDQQRYFINLLQALRNTFYTLIYDRGNTMIKIVHHDDNISAFPRDITALWSLKKEQWEHEKKTNREKTNWSADFYIAPRELHEKDHGGFPASEQSALLRERWGVENVYRDKAPKWPIKEGKYWPVGNGPPGWW